MSVSFNDFLTSANALLNADSTEIDFRNVISRSYYAAFHLSREVANNLEIPVSTDEYNKLRSHEKVIIKFEKSKDKSLQRLGYYLKKCKLKREKADYDIYLEVKRVETAQHFNEAKDLIKKLVPLKTMPQLEKHQ